MESFVAVILSAGKGTRMKSDIPKVLHEIKDKPIVEYVIDSSRKAGAKDIYVVVGYKKELVIDRLKEKNVIFVEQYKQLGTGHALMMVEPYLRSFYGTIVVLVGDAPLISCKTIKEIVRLREENKVSCVVVTFELDEPGSYGRIVKDEEGKVLKIVEAKDASKEELKIKELNSGIYAFESPYIFEALKRLNKNNAQGEYYLTDVIEIFINNNKKVLSYKVENPQEVLGVNTPQDLEAIKSLI